MKRLVVAFVALVVFSVASVVRAQSVAVNYLAAGATDSALVAAVTGTGPQLYFCGFSARETGAAAVSTVDIYAGTDATGRLLFSFSLLAGESRSEGVWIPSMRQCLPSPEGIFIDRGGAGTTVINIYTYTGN